MKPLLCKAEVVRNFLNVAVNSWPPKAIDPSKPFQWQDRRPVRGGLSTPISYLNEYAEGTPNSREAIAVFRHASGQSTHLISPISVGEIFYVRESFCRSESGQIFFKATDPFETCLVSDIYAPGKIPMKAYSLSKSAPWPGWTPSIHMPCELSRIHLEVMRVRVERACDISIPDCIAEGIPVPTDAGDQPKNSFWLLWTSLYGPDAWEKFVWVYDLKRVR